MSLPVLHLFGSAYEQGHRHGEILRDHVATNLDIYFERFEHEGGVSRPEALARVQRYLPAISRQNEQYLAGMQGIADGSGFTLLEIAALNLRYEMLYHQFTANAMADGCTAFATLPAITTTGHLLMGQNWDWIPQVRGALLHTTEPDGLETLSFTEAGIFGGKIGLNSAGLGLAINGLNTTDDDWSRLQKPFHLRCYEILRQRDVMGAARVVTGDARACSTNFLLAQAPDQVLDIEAAPHTVRVLQCADGCLVHTNHFLDPATMGIVEPPHERGFLSHHRLTRLRQLILDHRPLTMLALQAVLRDHADFPDSICRHPDPSEPSEQRYATVVSVVMDLQAGTLDLSDGAPCEHPYQRVSLW